METYQRINRIIGQLKGIQKMVESKRPCNDILQQISAVKKAIDGLSKEIVIADISSMLPQEETKKIEEVMKRMISL